MKTLDGVPHKIIYTNHGDFIVDAEANEIIKCWNWSAFKNQSGQTYCVGYNRKTKEKKLLHRLLLGLEKKDRILFADHIDGNTFDNRLINLRIVNKSQNAQNMRKTTRQKTSSFKGVFWDKSRNKWTAVVKFNQRRIFQLRSNDKIEAAWAYDFMAYNLFGAHALLNFGDT